MKENAFENSLKLTKITLLLSGITIYQTKWNKLGQYFLNCVFYLTFLWLYTDVVGEFYWLIEGIQIGKSFSELTLIAPCTTICLLSTAKSTPLYFNRQIVGKVIDKLRKIHPMESDKEEYDNEEIVAADSEIVHFRTNESTEIERKIVNDSIKFLNIVISLLYYSSGVVIVVFSLLPVMAMGYEYYNGDSVELKFPFFIKYFFDPFTKTRWPFVYIHQVWSTCIAAFNVFGADTFLYACCTYIQMHFRILCHRYERVISKSSRKTRERLLRLVKRHQELIHLVDDVEVMYSKSTLFNIVSSSVLICLSAFNVTFLDDAGAVFAFLTFLTLSLSQISLLCFFGDLLKRSSTEVCEAIYKCRWYDADATTKKSVFLILIRAQKPCKLTAANFADLDLTAFTTILSRSWSYFALLKTMYK